MSGESDGYLQSSTTTSIPVFCPFNYLPFNSLMYKETGSPRCSESILTE